MIRRLAWCAAAFAAAVFLAVYLLPENLCIPLGLSCLIGLLLAFLFSGRARRRVRCISIGLALGLLWTGCYGLLFRTPAHALITGTVEELTFVIDDFPRQTSSGISVQARLESDLLIDPLVLLRAEEGQQALQPGDVVTASVKLAHSGLFYGESFDYYETKGIYLLGYVQGPLTVVRRPSTVSPVYWAKWVAKAWKESIQRIFPADVSGFLIALITGDKTSLPTGQYAAFQRAGIAHIVAVSGLHITFLAGLFSFALGKRRRLGAAVSILLVFFYAAVAGNSPSALRAAIMTAILFLAPLLGRESDKATTLSGCLMLLLILRPYSAASVSLQLSFAAVAGIYLISGPLASRWITAIPKWRSTPAKVLRKVLVFLASTLAVTLGALLFTTPLCAIHFRAISLVGPLTNLLTLWAVSAAFFGGIFAAPLGLLSVPIGTAIAWVAAWPARWVILVAEAFSRWPYASIPLLSGGLIAWFVISYLILLLWLVDCREVRPAIPLAALVLTLSAALLVHAYPAISGTLTVAVLDVGQGASTLLYSKGCAVLVDCGGNSLNDPGDVAADYLQSLGLNRLDALILTHYHSDHANGVPELMARVDIGLLVLPDVTPEEPLRQDILALAQQYNCDVEFLYSYDAQITFGDAQLQVFIPMGDGGANEEGLSVLCTAGAYDVLITGDMNHVVESRLIKYKSLPDIELLVVGHHGSKSSTSEALLLATSPDQAVISVGSNTYGHPTDEVLERLAAAGCEIYRTDWMGTVTFSVSDE